LIISYLGFDKDFDSLSKGGFCWVFDSISVGLWKVSNLNEPQNCLKMIAAKQDVSYEVQFSQGVLFREIKQEFYSHEIMLLLANINYTTIYLQCGKEITSTKTLKKFEAPLTKIGFLRINKSVIINPAFMDNCTISEIFMQNGLIMKVARRRKRMMRETFLVPVI
jgi:LytTr DNA-binding domain